MIPVVKGLFPKINGATHYMYVPDSEVSQSQIWDINLVRTDRLMSQNVCYKLKVLYFRQ